MIDKFITRFGWAGLIMGLVILVSVFTLIETGQVGFGGLIGHEDAKTLLSAATKMAIGGGGES